MAKISRKIKRNKSREAEKDLQEKVALFDKIPESCLSCDTPFDRNNKEEVSNWRVVVREKEQRVNLYCPPCWKSAHETLKEIKERLEKKNV